MVKGVYERFNQDNILVEVGLTDDNLRDKEKQALKQGFLGTVFEYDSRLIYVTDPKFPEETGFLDKIAFEEIMGQLGEKINEKLLSSPRFLEFEEKYNYDGEEVPMPDLNFRKANLNNYGFDFNEYLSNNKIICEECKSENSGASALITVKTGPNREKISDDREKIEFEEEYELCRKHAQELEQELKKEEEFYRKIVWNSPNEVLRREIESSGRTPWREY